MKKILLATNGSGFQIDKCMSVKEFKSSISLIISDRVCPALDVAKHHDIPYRILMEKNSEDLNKKILALANEENVDFIISPGFTRIFRGEILENFENRIFNCHPSILPAFKGFYDTRDVKRTYHPRKIFERMMDFGSRIIGNTIHLVNAEVDDGYPIIVSSLNVPFNESQEIIRHRLFIQECKCLLQLVFWLNEERLKFNAKNFPYIEGAAYDEPYFSPNLDSSTARNFDLAYLYTK